MGEFTEKVKEEVRDYTDESADNALLALDGFFNVTDCKSRAFAILSLEETDDGISCAVSCLGLDDFNSDKSVGEVAFAKEMAKVSLSSFVAMLARKYIRDGSEKFVNEGMSSQLGAMAAAEFNSDEELAEFRSIAKKTLGIED